MEKYVEHDREIITNRSLKELTKLLMLQGLQMPPTLAVNKESGKAYFHDVNHRMSIFKRLNIKWLPISIKYDSYIYNNEDDLRFFNVPKVYSENIWPTNPTPTLLSFKSKPLPESKK